MPVPVDPRGLVGPTKGEARGKKWRRTARNRYVPESVERGLLDQRIVEAVAGMPDGALVTGWAALVWMGATWFDGVEPDGVSERPVPISLGDKRTASPRDGVQLCEDWLFASDRMQCDGLPITIPLRSISYEARRAPTLHRAVQALDMAMAVDLVTPGELCAYAERLPARRGIVQLKQAMEHADENVWSPREPLMRMAWSDAHHPRPLTNRPIFDLSGRHLLTPDLFDPDAAVAGEYDGAVHEGMSLRRRDLNREELYRRYGIELVTMMSTDRQDIASFNLRLHAAYARAATRKGPRPWTLEPPDTWVDTTTVAGRRALSGGERAVWLRHRSGWWRCT